MQISHRFVNESHSSHGGAPHIICCVHSGVHTPHTHTYGEHLRIPAFAYTVFIQTIKN